VLFWKSHRNVTVLTEIKPDVFGYSSLYLVSIYHLLINVYILPNFKATFETPCVVTVKT
jgi:hypothetical protein